MPGDAVCSERGLSESVLCLDRLADFAISDFMCW